VSQEVRRRRSVDDRIAQDIIRDAHRLGDLDLKIRWLDGSFGDLSRGDEVWGDDPWLGETWRRMFDHGIIEVERRVRRSLRRVGPSRPCRVYVTRESRDRFLGVGESQPVQDAAIDPSPSGKQPDNPTVADPALAAPETAAVERRTKPDRKRAEDAIRALYPDGVPPQSKLKNKQLCAEVLNQLGPPPVSDTTILRAAGRRIDKR
jgi:hypothetical protein